MRSRSSSFSGIHETSICSKSISNVEKRLSTPWSVRSTPSTSFCRALWPRSISSFTLGLLLGRTDGSLSASDAGTNIDNSVTSPFSTFQWNRKSPTDTGQCSVKYRLDFTEYVCWICIVSPKTLFREVSNVRTKSRPSITVVIAVHKLYLRNTRFVTCGASLVDAQAQFSAACVHVGSLPRILTGLLNFNDALVRILFPLPFSIRH